MTYCTLLIITAAPIYAAYYKPHHSQLPYNIAAYDN